MATTKKTAPDKTPPNQAQAEKQIESISGNLLKALHSLSIEIEKASKTDPGEVENLTTQFKSILTTIDEWDDRCSPSEYHDPRLAEMEEDAGTSRIERRQAPVEIWQLKETGEVGTFVENEEREDGLSYKILRLEDGSYVSAPVTEIQRIQ